MLDRRGPATTETLERMLLAAPHRGVDFRTVVLGNAALGVSVHDGWKDASMAAGDGMAAALAGDLSNEVELRKQLHAGEVPIPGDGAAETVIAAFRAWGDEAPSRMRGAFTGVVTDGIEMR